MKKTINLSELGGPVYAGRKKGEQARIKYKLDSLDISDTVIEVIVPDGTYSINSSFFLGFFGNSIRQLGSKDEFLKKYQFLNAQQFQEKIDEFISRALFEKKPLI